MNQSWLGVITAAKMEIPTIAYRRFFRSVFVESAPTGQLFASPEHPYTRGLLASSPRMRGNRGVLPAIRGQPPALGAAPLIRLREEVVLVARADHPDIRASAYGKLHEVSPRP